jgi:hypothetical protein
MIEKVQLKDQSVFAQGLARSLGMIAGKFIVQNGSLFIEFTE